MPGSEHIAQLVITKLNLQIERRVILSVGERGFQFLPGSMQMVTFILHMYFLSPAKI